MLHINKGGPIHFPNAFSQVNKKERKNRNIGRVMKRGLKRILSSQLLHKRSSYFYSEINVH